MKKNIKMIGVPDRFIAFGKRPELLAEINLDEEGIYKQIKTVIARERQRPRQSQPREWDCFANHARNDHNIHGD